MAIIGTGLSDPLTTFNFEGLDYKKGIWEIYYGNVQAGLDGIVLINDVTVGIRSTERTARILQHPIPITSYKDDQGTPYSSFNDLITDLTIFLGFEFGGGAGNISLNLVGTDLVFIDNEGNQNTISLTSFLDDSNLSRIESVTLGLDYKASLIRDDNSVILLDLKPFFDLKADISHTHTKSDITDFNDTDYATASQGTNADNAFGWGDHALAGYLTSFTETDPVFQASEASNFVAGDKANLDNQSGINTGDETTITIQTKRPLKTINGETIDGIGNIQIAGGNQAFVNRSVLYKAFSDVTPAINNSFNFTPLFYKPAVTGTFDDTIFAPVANGVQLLKDLENLTIIASVYVTSDGQRTSLGVSIFIDGVASTVEAGGYIRADSGHNEDDFKVIETFPSLPAGTVITAQSRRTAGASNNTQSVEDKGILSVFGFVPDTAGVVIGFPTPIITSISTT